MQIVTSRVSCFIFEVLSCRPLVPHVPFFMNHLCLVVSPAVDCSQLCFFALLLKQSLAVAASFEVRTWNVL